MRETSSDDMEMPERPVRYWNRHLFPDGGWRPGVRKGPPGEELADLRAGLGRPAAAVPAMWPYYTSLVDGRVTPELEAEHGALALYGLHQQSQIRPMHKKGIGLGTALRSLRETERFSEEALDRRVAAAANARTLPVLLYRLRGLVPLLRTDAVPFDYDRMMRDLERWPYPESRQRVRQAWGLSYFASVERKDRGSGAEAPALKHS